MPPKGLQYGGTEEKKLVSLEDHNKKAYETDLEAQAPTPNGIACPQCGDELIDVTPHVIIPTQPPQTYISCSSCGYQGFRNV